VEADTEIEERGKRKEERGKRKEERGKRKEERIFNFQEIHQAIF
jgi:hypothetical protein